MSHQERKKQGHLRLPTKVIHTARRAFTRADVSGAGTLYYALGTKKESISAKKRLLLVSDGLVFANDTSRDKLRWYESGTFSSNDVPKGATVFVESTSHNRIVRAGQEYMIGTPAF